MRETGPCTCQAARLSCCGSSCTIQARSCRRMTCSRRYGAVSRVPCPTWPTCTSGGSAPGSGLTRLRPCVAAGTVSARADPGSLAGRFLASRWPEATWAAFAAGNLAWIVTMPSWSLLPWHFIWMSLLLLYGFGFRTWTRPLLWSLLTPVLAAIALLFADPAIRGLRPYDEVVEVPFMAALFAAMVLQSGRRRAAISAHDEVSRRNLELLERQRVFIQNASHQLRTPITVALAHAELLPSDEADPAAADDAAIVVEELTRLRGLVGHLLQLATAEQGDALRLAAVPTQLTPLLDDLVRRW